jgi:sugar/nucleoside kinase (ribokinase family)
MWWLRQEGIDLSAVVRVEDAQTTRFELEYAASLESRVLRLKGKAPPINVGDLPNPMKARIVHIAPIADEIAYDVVEELRNNAEVLSIDPQGLLRKFDADGNVTTTELMDKRILGLVNICKSSSDEITALTGSSDLGSAIKAVHDYGVETVIVTLGAKGNKLSVEGTLYDVPTFKTSKFVDPTGAGDVFIGAFLAEYVRGEDSLWCACVGSAAASLAVEAVGPTFQGDKTEIYSRAQALYGKEIKE